MLFNLFKRIRISYCITVCNEAKELNTLLSALIPLIDRSDEIIVLQDITRPYPEVNEVIEKHKTKIRHVEALLNNDFATFKNNFLAIATGNYLFQIDADEVPRASLITMIKPFLRKIKSKYDSFMVPRINIVNGYTPEHIEKWNWNVNENGYINFPDYQPRIIKLNGKIKWKNKVHEVFTGFNRVCELPSVNDDYCLIHIKDIKRQEKQNAFYDTFTDQPPAE